MAHCTGGGALVLGVDARFQKSDRNLNLEDIIARISNLAHDTQEPPIGVEVHYISTNIGKLLCLHILSAKTIPVFIKDKSPFGGQACFKRTGSQTVAMTVEEIRNLLAASQMVYFDEGTAECGTFSDLDFRMLQKAINQFNPELGDSKQNRAVLIDSGVLLQTASTSNITIAGWQMFAKKPQCLRGFKNAFIEFQQFRGMTRDEPLKKTEIRGSLPE